LAHSAKIFPNSRHQKIFLVRHYHHAKFWVNRSTIKGFMVKFQFFLTPGVKFWDEPGAEEVRDGPMVSFTKMMLMISTFTMINMRPNFFFTVWLLKKVAVKSPPKNIQVSTIKHYEKRSSWKSNFPQIHLKSAHHFWPFDGKLWRWNFLFFLKTYRENWQGQMDDGNFPIHTWLD
jgi:hypothetical protein